MKHLKAYALVTASVLFFSCQKVIQTKDLPQQDARLVVNSILITDSLVSAKVSLSRSILNSDPYKHLDNATCALFENDVFVQNMTGTGDGNYISTVIAKPNKKYTLKVSASGFKDVEGSTSLLGPASFTNVERYDSLNSFYSVEYFYDSSSIVNQIDGVGKFKLRIIDDPAVKNYYTVRPVVLLFDSAGQQLSETVNLNIYNNLNTDQGGSLFGNGDNPGGSTLDFDDQVLVNGREIQVDIGVGIYSNPINFKTMKLYLYIYSLNGDYYRYKSTLQSQGTVGDSPFAEPVLVYSNFTGGMGIIAGASTSSVLVLSGTPH